MKPSKPFTTSLRLAVAAALGLACSVTAASAQTTLTFDADTTAPANDGSNVWDTTTANWYNGTTDQLWTNGLADTAIFGAAAAGTGGTVTVGTVNVGTIQFNPQTTTAYTLSGGTITLGTGITTTSTLNSTISSVITGTNGLAFTGVAGASAVGVTLSGANTYTGITTLSTGGRITTSNAASLGSNAGATASALGTNYTQVNAGTTVQVGVSTAEAFLINGSGSIASGNPPGALRIANGVTLSSFMQLGSNAVITSNFGTITISGNVDMGAFTLGVGNGSNGVNLLTVSGVVTGGATSVLDIGAGGGTNVVNLTNNANTFSGTTRVNASSGTSSVGLGGDTVLGTSTLVFASGGIQSTNATARTINNTIGTFTGNAIFGQTTGGTGALAFTSTTASALGAARTFTTNVNTSFANAFTGTGTSGIVKAGTATLTLNGASTYAGATTVNAGTLLVNNTTGSGTGTGSVTVNNTGSVLGGTGILAMTGAGVATVNTGATLAPGTTAAPGIFSIAGAQTTTPTAVGAATVNLLSGSNLTIRLNGALAGTGYDQLNVTGTVALGGGNLNLSLTGFTPTNGQKFVIVNNDGNDIVFGTFNGLADGSVVTVGSQQFAINYNAVGGGDGIANDVVLTAVVPEPGTWAMLAGGLSLAGFVRYRCTRRGGEVTV